MKNTMREIVTVYVPRGYSSAQEFLDDCGLEACESTQQSQPVLAAEGDTVERVARAINKVAMKYRISLLGLDDEFAEAAILAMQKPSESISKIAIPANIHEAECMAKMGLHYLAEYAPDRLKSEAFTNTNGGDDE